MKQLMLVAFLTFFSVLASYSRAAVLMDPIDIHDAWGFGIGYLRAPYGDGSIFTINSPSVYSRKMGESTLKLARSDISFNLDWDFFNVPNVVMNASGNYSPQSPSIFILNSKYSLSTASNNMGFIEIGYAAATGVGSFTTESVNGFVLTFGVTTGAASIRLANFLTPNSADKVAGSPNIFGGTYISLAFDFEVVKRSD